MFRILYKNGTYKDLETPQNASVTKIKSSELDSVSLTLPHVEELNLHFKDKIIIENKKYYCGSFKKEQATKNGLFNYIIALISPTIALEDYILPNRTITALIENKRNLDYYFEKYLEEYAPHITLDEAFKTKLATLEAYEEQFPCLNLREVFNKMLEPYGLVCKMDDYNVLSYLDLNDDTDELDINDFNFVERENSFDEYASCLQMNVENAISSNYNVSEKGVTIKSNEAVVNDSNMIIPTKEAIYDISKVYCICKLALKNAEDEKPTYGLYSLDITKYIIEKSIYDTKKVSAKVSEDSLEYKRNCLYFNHDSKNIEGLTYQESTWFAGIQTYIALENVLTLAAKSFITNYEQISISTNVRDLIFDIEYKAKQSINVKFFKDYYTNERTLIDNQTSSYVDIDKLSKSEKEKVNRCGNEKLHLGGRFSYIPSINSRIGDYKTTQLTAIYENGYYNVDMYLFKNFTRQNQAQALSQQIRYTQIDTSSNAVTRIENTVINAVITTEESISNLGSALLLDKPLYIYKTFSNNVLLSTNIIFPSKQKMDCSLILGFKMEDNFSSGLCIGSTREYGGYGLEKVPYVDENGECEEVSFLIYDGFPVIDEKNNEKNFASYTALVRKFPRYEITNEVLKFGLELMPRYKDNREILGETIQINIKPANNNIILYDGFYSMLLSERYLESNAGKVSIVDNKIIVEQVVNHLIIYNYNKIILEVYNNTSNTIYIKEVK